MHGRIISYLSFILFSFFSGIILVSCGGGGSGSLPASAAPDTNPPFILAASPTPGQKSVGTVTFLDIKFNEAVTNYRADNFIIKSYSGNILNTTPITIDATDFFFNDKDNTLSVNLNNKLTSKMKYQVTIENVKDDSGNIMLNKCQWEFSTVDYSAFVSSDILMDCGKPQDINDTTSPVVIIMPEEGSVNVNTSTDIDVMFNKAMNPVTLESNIKLYKMLADGTQELVAPFPYDYSYDPIQHKISYRANQIPALLVQQQYKIVITSGDQGILDYNGNKLDINKTISFKTRDVTGRPTDTVPPEVVLVNPPDNATSVDITTNIGIAFNEAMNSLLLQSKIKLERLDKGNYVVVTPFPFSFGINNSKTTVILTQINPPKLLSGVQYKVTIEGGPTGVTDIGGIPLANNFSFVFTTLAVVPILN